MECGYHQVALPAESAKDLLAHKIATDSGRTNLPRLDQAREQRVVEVSGRTR